MNIKTDNENRDLIVGSLVILFFLLIVAWFLPYTVQRAMILDDSVYVKEPNYLNETIQYCKFVDFNPNDHYKRKEKNSIIYNLHCG